MALAVCLLFDGRSERAIRGVWQRFEDNGIPSLGSHTHGRHVPHVSYAVLRDWDLDAVTAAVEALGHNGAVDLSFDGIGLFRRGRVWLLAGVPSGLVARQDKVVDAVTATGADLHKHYRPGVWLPHCSVAPRVPLAQLTDAASLLYDVLPLQVRLDRAALINSATAQVWPLAGLP